VSVQNAEGPSCARTAAVNCVKVTLLYAAI
jgi:hypothetical protein